MLTQTSTASSDGTTPKLLTPTESSSHGTGEQHRADPATTDVQATLRRRVLSPQTLISFGIAIAILWFVARRLDVDPGAIWAQIRRANLWLLAVAFLLWYGAFFVRGRRWGRMLSSAGFNQAHGFRLPATP